MVKIFAGWRIIRAAACLDGFLDSDNVNHTQEAYEVEPAPQA